MPSTLDRSTSTAIMSASAFEMIACTRSSYDRAERRRTVSAPRRSGQLSAQCSRNAGQRSSSGHERVRRNFSRVDARLRREGREALLLLSNGRWELQHAIRAA